MVSGGALHDAHRAAAGAGTRPGVRGGAAAGGGWRARAAGGPRLLLLAVPEEPLERQRRPGRHLPARRAPGLRVSAVLRHAVRHGLAGVTTVIVAPTETRS